MKEISICSKIVDTADNLSQFVILQFYQQNKMSLYLNIGLMLI
jgi:hypothetical protein